MTGYQGRGLTHIWTCDPGAPRSPAVGHGTRAASSPSHLTLHTIIPSTHQFAHNHITAIPYHEHDYSFLFRHQSSNIIFCCFRDITTENATTLLELND